MNYLFIVVFLLFAVLLIADENEGTSSEQSGGGDDSAVLQAHRYFAADFFNRCWDYIDQPERSSKDEIMMIHTAHASRAHWEAVGDATNHAVGEWQISRVYALLNRPAEALLYAEECLSICRNNDLGGFNLGFAYEALARAEYLLGNEKKADEYITLGKEAAEQISEEDDRNYLLGDLDSIKK
jgi:hypothetical protein